MDVQEMICEKEKIIERLRNCKMAEISYNGGQYSASLKKDICILVPKKKSVSSQR
jgi:hypothetical protein